MGKSEQEYIMCPGYQSGQVKGTTWGSWLVLSCVFLDWASIASLDDKCLYLLSHLEPLKIFKTVFRVVF